MKILRPAISPLASDVRALAVAPVLLFCAAPSFAAPVHLRVNQRVDPLGIDSAAPTLSWQSDSTDRNWTQSAYRIIVATSPAALRAEHPDVWDSGRQTSSESVNVVYAGPALKSHQRCYWAVHTWDAKGKEERSTEAAWWEIGLLQPSDWQAQWIRRSDDDETAILKKIAWIWLPDGDAQHIPQGAEAEFRYNLHLSKVPASASLHVFAGGIFTTRVNGVVTGHKDQWGSFDREDIREQLHAGDNQIVIQIETPKSNDANKTFRAALTAALQLTNDSGKTNWIESDQTSRR